jgi:hypothetical protein
MRRLALVLFITLMIASTAFIVGTVGQLPPRVASHFGGAGQVNAWMTRDGYLLFMLGFATLFPLFIVASIAGLPHLTSRGVKLPNRDHWLAPPRRDARGARGIRRLARNPVDRLHRRAALHDCRGEHERAAAAARTAALECPRRLCRRRPGMASFILFAVSKRFADVRGYRACALARLS